MKNNSKSIMVQYTNSTHASGEWRFSRDYIPFKESIVVAFVLLYGLRIQLQKHNRQRNLQLIQRFSGRVIQLLNTLMNWCAHFQDYDEINVGKKTLEARVAPHENEILMKVEKKKMEKHPWDIAHEIIKEQEQAALAVKWAIIPIEVLMDEQFLKVLHSIEEITDTTPLRDAARQLPKQLYGIIQAHEQITRIPGELTDQLVFDMAKTYYYSVIRSLCKLIRSIQQGQWTTLITLAKIIQEQRDEIEGFQMYSRLPEEIKQLQQRMEQLKRHVNTQLERMDKRASVASVTISELKSRVHILETALETSLDFDPRTDESPWASPGEFVELVTPEVDVLFCEGQGEMEPSNEQQQIEENLAIGGEPQEHRDNIPQRLSSPGRHIPGGAKESDSSQSPITTEGEENVEEGLAHFFDNPSYRAADPALQQPVEPEEDWGDTPPVLIPIPITPGPPPQTMRALKRQRYLQRRRERRRQDEGERDQN